jgi:hypothetical protein
MPNLPVSVPPWSKKKRRCQGFIASNGEPDTKMILARASLQVLTAQASSAGLSPSMKTSAWLSWTMSSGLTRVPRAAIRLPFASTISSSVTIEGSNSHSRLAVAGVMPSTGLGRRTLATACSCIWRCMRSIPPLASRVLRRVSIVVRRSVSMIGKVWPIWP